MGRNNIILLSALCSLLAAWVCYCLGPEIRLFPSSWPLRLFAPPLLDARQPHKLKQCGREGPAVDPWSPERAGESLVGSPGYFPTCCKAPGGLRKQPRRRRVSKLGGARGYEHPGWCLARAPAGTGGKGATANLPSATPSPLAPGIQACSPALPSLRGLREPSPGGGGFQEAPSSAPAGPLPAPRQKAEQTGKKKKDAAPLRRSLSLCL